MEETAFNEVMRNIVAAIRSVGHDPYNQLISYLETGHDCYITRTGNARSMIRLLDKRQIMQYVLKMYNR